MSMLVTRKAKYLNDRDQISHPKHGLNSITRLCRYNKESVDYTEIVLSPYGENGRRYKYVVRDDDAILINIDPDAFDY